MPEAFQHFYMGDTTTTSGGIYNWAVQRSQGRTCMISVGALILEMSLMLGKTSSQEGQRVHVGFMTLMPVARGLCSMTPAKPGTLAPR